MLLQDFLVNVIVAFNNVTGSRGAGFDYTFLDNPAASIYSQWYGWRRVLLLLREVLGDAGVSDFVVDNRQSNHEWGPWMWMAGSYAEPLQTDEQPESWPAYLWVSLYGCFVIFQSLKSPL